MTDHYRTSTTSTALHDAAWSVCAQSPGAITHPSQLTTQPCDWLAAPVPGTVASALNAAGQWQHGHAPDIEAQDWWYRTTFPAPARADEPCVLCLDGLATLAEVWLNGTRLLSTDNMFRAHRVSLAEPLLAENELTLCFRSLTTELKRKRPRPRWKTNLANHQQLRFVRTTLLGHMPGWSPPVPAVGPWRAIRLECAPVLISEVQRTATLDGDDGLVHFRAKVEASTAIKAARLRIGAHETTLHTEHGTLHGELRVPTAQRWWPHTDGEPHRYDCTLVVETDADTHEFALAPVGFRTLEVRTEPGFGLVINGEPIHCRGACWTVSDIFSLSGDEASLRHDLTLARDAGMNMLRLTGTMVYENDTFYHLCDALGILVWQDFMFANMDYPVEDPAFAENIATEAIQQLDRLALHPCVAVYCGNSEIEQQAAMLGLSRELWRNAWFGETLPALCAQHHPGTAYVPSSPSGGVMPFHPSSGIAHYYGIGAYLRSLRELRQADVKFTTECVAFAQVPEPETIDAFMGGLVPVTHHPRWKARVPRDTGSGWDFEDVRDHYLAELFHVDPAKLHSFDMPRYLELSRVVSGEMMARAMHEWRSTHSRNAGALVYFLKDLWPATGWGIVDSFGLPKAAYYQLKRTWQTRQLTLTDEGLDGLHLHLINETREPIEGTLEVLLLREPNVIIAKHEVAITVDGRSKAMRSAEEIIGHFSDVNYAYRFGPAMHHVVVATWFNAQREVLSEAFHLTRQRDPEPHTVPWHAEGEALVDGRYRVSLRSDAFLHHVRCSAKGFLPDDNYFHLVPSRTKTVIFSPIGGHSGPLRASIEALNALGDLSVSVKALPP